MQQADRDECIKKICDAFASNEHVPDQIVFESDCSLEAQALHHALKGRKWHDLACDYMNEHAVNSLFLLGYAAYRYFLPAFMLCAAKNYDQYYDIACDTIDSLVPPKTYQKVHNVDAYNANEPVDMYSFVCRMRDLTDKQVEAVVSFLIYINKYYGADFPGNELQLALEEYWSDRLEKGRRELNGF